MLFRSGYTGVIVTDHFFNGNTSVSSHLGWEERVNAFMKGFEDAFNEGKKYDMDVFFGWEACYHGTEFLIYGLDKEWLLHHEDILTWSIEEQYEQVTNSGGMVVHAHPFREAFYIPEVRLYPNHVDAVEVYNMSNERLDTEFNKRAKEYAEQNQLPMTGGSDVHNIPAMSGGMVFDKRLYSIVNFINAVKEKQGTILL